MPIPQEITRDHLLQALEALDAGATHAFGEATTYELVHEGRSYSPKAVIGLAAQLGLGISLSPSDFSGGESPGAANPFLRDRGFEVRQKAGQAPTADETSELSSPTDDARLVGITLDSLVEDALERGAHSAHADPEAWLANRAAVDTALQELGRTRDLTSFAASLSRVPNPPEWAKIGAHRTFLSTLAERSNAAEAAEVVQYAYTAPQDEAQAIHKIDALVGLAESVERLYPGPGFAPLAVSLVWCMVDPDEWPWLSPEAEAALHVLRLVPRYLVGSHRYHPYRRLVLHSSHPATVTVTNLAFLTDQGSRSLSSAVYERLVDNSRLLADWYETGGYRAESDRQRAERNIQGVSGEIDLFSKGMLADVEDRLVRDLETSKTDIKVSFDAGSPFRADSYAIFTIEKNMAKPSIRVWLTPRGLAVGAHFGVGHKYDEALEVARSLSSDLADDGQFFEVREHRIGDRLEPIGKTPRRGELFVGRWFEGGLTGTDVGTRTLETVAQLQSVFDRMIRASGEAPGAATSEDDELAPLYEEFVSITGYPTEADLTDRAEREQMEAVISEEGLLAFDLHEFRRIYNTARYGSPGPQSILNASLNQMSPEELDLFANNLEFLLRGASPVEDRVNQMMDQSDKGIKGFGEAVITKLLAISHPTQIVPVFVYRGPKGKARMLNLLGLREEGLDNLDVGSRLVRSNDLLRDRLAPLFGDDMLGMARFLYWLSERDEIEESPGDETDRIGNLADEVLVAREDLDEIVALLESKRQVIFYGPPGTGKTYLARELAKAIASDPAQRVLVQFHPSTSYEDFFEGYRPETDGEGRLTYRLVKGPLAIIADRARENRLKKYIMVIDEINRANLPKVFGELLFLLEYRDESVRSLYRPDEPFELPDNLWFIGTMNTADRSIALVDAAMRRRFHFVPFFPNEGMMSSLLSRWLTQHGKDTEIADLLDMVNDDLRQRLGGPHLQIGPSHFMRDDLSEEVLERIWKYSVHPYIDEQLYGDQSAIKDFEYNAVRRRFRNGQPGLAAEADEPDDLA